MAEIDRWYLVRTWPYSAYFSGVPTDWVASAVFPDTFLNREGYSRG